MLTSAKILKFWRKLLQIKRAYLDNDIRCIPLFASAEGGNNLPLYVKMFENVLDFKINLEKFKSQSVYIHFIIFQILLLIKYKIRTNLIVTYYRKSICC